jgi:hypothetical protein
LRHGPLAVKGLPVSDCTLEPVLDGSADLRPQSVQECVERQSLPEFGTEQPCTLSRGPHVVATGFPRPEANAEGNAGNLGALLALTQRHLRAASRATLDEQRDNQSRLQQEQANGRDDGGLVLFPR